MDKKFIDNFLKEARRIDQDGKKLSWDIPQKADKKKGDFGLLAEDKNIEAWSISETSAEFLRFLVTSKKCKTVLELGASIGYSTIFLALGAKEIGGHVYTTEIFKPKVEIAKENFKKTKLNKYVTVLEEKILKILKNWKYGKIDLVFMDADKQNYKKYLKLLLPLLSSTGVIVADNAGDYPKYMKDFLKECPKLGYQVYFLNVDNGLMIINKASKVNLVKEQKQSLPSLVRKNMFGK